MVSESDFDKSYAHANYSEFSAPNQELDGLDRQLDRASMSVKLLLRASGSTSL